MPFGDIFSGGGLATFGPAGLGAIALSGGLGYLGQTEANATNKRIAEDNRDFQERMSSTAVRRGVADMKAAGINPLLAAGSPASTPSGSTATMENALEGVQASARDFATTGLTAQKQNAEIGLMHSQKANTDANTLKAKADTQKSLVDAEVARKGIPESDLKNKGYDVIRPVVDKLYNYLRTGSKHIPVKGAP